MPACKALSRSRESPQDEEEEEEEEEKEEEDVDGGGAQEGRIRASFFLTFRVPRDYDTKFERN